MDLDIFLFLQGALTEIYTEDFNKKIFKQMLSLGRIEIFTLINFSEFNLPLIELKSVLLKNLTTENFSDFTKLCNLKTELGDIGQIIPIFAVMKHFDIYLTIQ